MKISSGFMPLILISGAALRFYLLGEKSIWADEAGSFFFAALPLPELISRSIATDVHPPLFYIVLHFWFMAFGKTGFALRSLSAILGTFSIALIFQVATKMFDKKVGIISAFLFSISVFHIHFSQELRGYSLLVFLSLGSMIFFLDFLRREGKSSLIGYLISTVLMLYCHNFGVLLVIVQNLWFFLFSYFRDPATAGKMRVWCLIQFAAGCCFLAWFLGMWGQLGNIKNAGSLAWVPLPSIQTVFLVFLEFCGAVTSCHQGIDFSTDNSAPFLFMFLSAISASLALFSITRTNRPVTGIPAPICGTGQTDIAPVFDRVKNLRWEISFCDIPMNLLLLLWLMTPIGISFAVSHLFQPVFVSRTLIVASIPLFILSAKGIAALRNNYLEGAVLGLSLIFSLGCLDQYFSTPTKCQWNKAVPWIEAQAGKKDLLLFDTNHSQLGYDFYATPPLGEPPASVLGTPPLGEPPASVLGTPPLGEPPASVLGTRSDVVRKGFAFENNSITEETVKQLVDQGRNFERILLVRSHSLDFEKYAPLIMGKLFQISGTQNFFGIEVYSYKTKK